MRVVAIAQARMGSTRLPGKVLQGIAGEPMLSRCVTRLRRAESLDELVIATTRQPDDERIIDLCRKHGWAWFRGSEHDVLDRYYKTASEFGADAVVRVTSDCPLIDPGVVDWVVKEFADRQPDVDYASNTFPQRTFPRGLDTEMVRFDALARAWREDDDAAWREHVTPYIWHRPESFTIHGVTSEMDCSAMRWTVDTPEDLRFVRRVFEYFGHDMFSWREVLKALDKHPDWLEINHHVQQKAL